MRVHAPCGSGLGLRHDPVVERREDGVPAVLRGLRAPGECAPPPRRRRVLLGGPRRGVRPGGRRRVGRPGAWPVRYDYGLWGFAAIHVAWLILFVLGFLRPGHREWRSAGILTAFIVALYVEMYGFPLTIFLLTSFFGGFPVPEPFAHPAGNLWATLLFGPAAARPLMLLGDLLLLVGTLVLAAGWRTLYRARGELATRGLYAVVRHPQYSALLLIIFGALIQWPTIPTLLMAPMLIVSYVGLAWREEYEMEARFGQAYPEYRRRVPGFIPALPLPFGGPSGVSERDRQGTVVSHK